MTLRPLHLLLATVLVCFAGAACNTAAAKTSHRKSSHHSESSGPPLVIRGDLATSRGLDAVAQAYEDAGKGKVEVQPFNTVSGIDATLNGTADIAASARPGFPGRAQEAGLTFTPVAWDALVMITSPDNPVSNITLKQLHDIYWGKITNWSELGGKDEPIDLYTIASPLDGSEYSLRRLLYGRGNAPIVMPRSYINVDTLEQGIALDPKSLGLSSLSGVRGNRKVKIIPVEGVMPTATTIADGSYPLYSAIYLATNPNNPHASQVRQFMDFLASDEAKKLMREHDLLPYADAALQSPDQQLAAVTAKMVSEGLPASQETHAEVAATQAQAAPALPTGAPSSTVASAAQVAEARVSPSARTAADPGVKHAEAVAPSNPVVVAASGAVTPVNSVATPDRPARYTVDKGDTLSKIARRYSVSVADLRKWNDLKNDVLQVGQVLQLRSN